MSKKDTKSPENTFPKLILRTLRMQFLQPVDQFSTKNRKKTHSMSKKIKKKSRSAFPKQFISLRTVPMDKQDGVLSTRARNFWHKAETFSSVSENDKKYKVFSRKYYFCSKCFCGNEVCNFDSPTLKILPAGRNIFAQFPEKIKRQEFFPKYIIFPQKFHMDI